MATPEPGLISREWILAQPEAALRYPGSHVILADSREEVRPWPDDYHNPSAYSRAFLRGPAGREEVIGWYAGRLEAAGWTLLQAPPTHAQHWHVWGRANERFNLFCYDRSPFAENGQGLPGPSEFEKPGTVHQVFFEARAAGFDEGQG